MENLILKRTLSTPSVNLDAKQGLIELVGKSIPENPLDFYVPLINWISEYSKEPRQQTHVNILLEYYNSSSLKQILELLRRIEQLYKQNNDVLVKWHCEEDDVDMIESIEVIKSVLEMPLEIIKIVRWYQD